MTSKDSSIMASTYNYWSVLEDMGEGSDNNRFDVSIPEKDFAIAVDYDWMIDRIAYLERTMMEFENRIEEMENEMKKFIANDNKN